jgi:hypothetical protein
MARGIGWTAVCLAMAAASESTVAAERVRPAAKVLAELPENTWVRLVAEPSGPWKRNYCGMCFDTRQRRVLSWGGAHFSYPGNEVQAYRVGSDRWVSLNERHVPPPAVRWWGGGTPGAVDPLGQPLAAHSYDDLVYDPVGHEMIWLPFGGDGAWHFDLTNNRWRLRMPAQCPSHGFAASTAYVSHGRLVATATPRSDDLYLYDIAKGTFAVTSKLPERPYNSGMTYDSRNKLVVLAGGKLQDTWLYSIETNKWRKADREGEPQGVHAVGVAFDSINNVVIVAGAEKLNGRQYRNRTWILDAATGKWSDPKPEALPDVPLAGIFGSLVFDPTHNVTLVTWGHGWRGKCETWAYRYRARAEEPTAVIESPNPRQPAKARPRPKRPMPKAEPTVGWVRLNPGEPPASPWFRGLSGAVYCEGADRVFFWGRSAGNSAGSQSYAELFDPASGQWEKAGHSGPGAPGPALELTFAMLSYDAARNRVLFPFVSGDPTRSRTWAFDMTKRLWLDLQPKTQPRVVPLGAAVYDGANMVTVLFGGSFDGEPQTWLYDSTENEWRTAQPKTSPSARVWHNMAFDRAAGAVVLFGGHDGNRDLGDTWLYSAAENTWTEVTPPADKPSPGPRCGHALAYDVARGATILFGGHTTKYNDEADEEAYLYQKSHSDRGIAHGDTWAFHAATRGWRLLAPEESPPPAATICGAMVYDSRRSQMILMHPWKPRGPEAKKYNTCQVWSLGSGRSATQD